MIDITGLREDKRPQSPIVVHAILDRLEATEEDRARFLLEMGRLCAQCDALRAKIAEMEKQEPVATVIKKGADRYWMSERLGEFHDGTYPLYALPGAKGEEK